MSDSELIREAMETDCVQCPCCHGRIFRFDDWMYICAYCNLKISYDQWERLKKEATLRERHFRELFLGASEEGEKK